MASTSFAQPPPDLAATFNPDMFKGKVLFCTGGGSGICKAMTESIVCPALVKRMSS
jgi:peroxisomal 2,4-dienoyl-CoA reductase